ncbi:recombinase RecA [bacterium]|nr:recombinase RecA [bacterium]NCQ54864.1 recombinase RecA [Candidatus Parcubacteria bacterium]NCS66908.1 recombinase RecA [Candidatus Peregrinibacteria bacterium]NCS95854.1 recombinase RecA [bacterium]
MDTGRQEALKAALSQIEKNFGKGAIMRMGDQEVVKLPKVSSGSISIDLALGGGYPKGRIIEVYGPESSGKTTLCLHATAEFQKAGGVVAFIDAEHALDPAYAAKVGVDVDNLLLSQPDSGEQALDICEALVRSGGVDLIVVDSVAALTPRAEIEGDMGDSHMGLQARLMSQALRKLTATAAKMGTTIIFINQLRMKIGVMFGNPETTTGGNALKFYASVRVEVRKGGKLETGTGDDKEAHGNEARIKVVKNKVAPPFKTATVDIVFNEGISKAGDLLDVAVKLDIIQKAGAFYSYLDTKLGQGKAKAVDFLKANPDLMTEIDTLVREKAGV